MSLVYKIKNFQTHYYTYVSGNIFSFFCCFRRYYVAQSVNKVQLFQCAWLQIGICICSIQIPIKNTPVRRYGVVFNVNNFLLNCSREFKLLIRIFIPGLRISYKRDLDFISIVIRDHGSPQIWILLQLYGPNGL